MVYQHAHENNSLGSALWKAVHNGDLRLARRLLEDDRVDVDGLGCLWETDQEEAAEESGQEEVETELVEEWDIETGEYQFVEYTPEEDAKPELLDKPNYTTPLHTAVQRTNWVCLKGTGVEKKDDGTEIVKLLLQYGADPMFEDSDKFSVLNAAASNGVSWHGSPEVVTLLLQKGADVNQANECGESPLHNAAFYGYAPVVAVLLEHGASLLLRTRADLTAQGMALASQVCDSHQEVLEVLEAAMNRDKCMAFAMGLHPRLGANSLVLALDPEMLRMVASELGPFKGLA
jgi:hypothetical protein